MKNVRGGGRVKSLCLETLEERALLSVSAAEFSQLRADYPEFELPESQAELNVIEITADQISLENLEAAITEAGTTTQDDLIVVRTTDEANKITFASEYDGIGIRIDSQTYGELTLVALGTKPLTLDAAQKCRVLVVERHDSIVEIGNLTMTNGNTTGSGGGIVNCGVLTLANATVSNCCSVMNGAGILNSGVFTLTNSTVSGNTMNKDFLHNVGKGGGGICNSGSGDFTLTNSTVSGNAANKGFGGGIYNEGSFTATNATVSDNTATHGGGIFHELEGDVFTLTNATVSGNTAEGGWGGGIGNRGSAFTLTNATVSGNIGNEGGGICNVLGDLTATNATVSGNTATKGGGGICGWSGTFTTQNSIVALNFSNTGADVYRRNGTLDARNVLSSDADWSTSENAFVYDSSAPLFVVAPIFDENGALTNADELDLRLAENSQALDRGNNEYVAGVETDLAGNARIQGAAVDLGAYETAPKTPLESVSIRGTVEIGQTLTATVSPSGATAAFQWYRGDEKIDGATAATYTIQTADAGFALTVKASGVGSYDGTVQATTAVVPNPDDEYEENDSRSDAYNLGTLTATKTLDAKTVGNDEDWFKFATTVAGTNADSVTLTYSHDATSDVDVYLYDANGTELRKSTKTTGTETISLNGLDAGTYYVKIFNYRKSGAVPYALTITPPSYDEYEPNDALATAFELGTLDATKSLVAKTVGADQDWFAFTTTVVGTSADSIKLTYSHNATSDVDVYLYNANGEQVGKSTRTTGTETISLDGLAAGSYYVKIFNYRKSGTVPYALTITPPTDDEYERNDTLATAFDLRTLTAPQTLAAKTVGNDQDWFKFTTTVVGTNATSVKLTYSHNATSDVDVYLFNANGEQIGKSTGTTGMETVSLNGLAAGSYYVKIFNYRKSGTVSYALTITPPTDDEYEQNDTLRTARDLGTLDATQTLSAQTVGNDQDWFKFATTVAGTNASFVKATYSHGATSDVDVYLYNANGEEVGKSTKTTGTETISLNGLAAGTYFVKVVNYKKTGTAPYTLTLTPPAPPVADAAVLSLGALDALFADADEDDDVFWLV